MNCGNKNLILGLPWLKEVNPIIDWGKETLSLDEKIDKAGDLLHQHEVWITSYSTFNPPKSADPPTGPSYYDCKDRDWLFAYNNFEEPEPYNDWALVAAYKQRVLNIAIKKWPNNEYIRKVNVAMELAQEAEWQKPKPILPPKFSEYANVFDKSKDGILPPPQPYDHAINLGEDFIPKVAKAYPLSPKERETAEKFVEDNLREGKIRPSKSLQAALFFFVRKKDGSL